MKYVTTVILVILTMIMGLYVALSGESEETPGAREKRVFEGFQPREVKAVSWEREDDRIRVEKKDGRWMIVEPSEFPADSEGVEALLTDFETLFYSRRISKDIDRAEYGLSPPSVTVRVEGGLPGGREAVLRIGGSDLTDRYIYVARGEKDEALVVSNHVKNTLDKGLDDIRSKDALIFDYERAEYVLLQSDIGKEVRVKKIGRSYALVNEDGSLKLRAHRETMEDIMRRLETLKMKRFVQSGENALAEHGLDEVSRRVIVTLDDREEHDLLIGGECELEGKIYEGEFLVGRMQPAPAVFCLAASDVNRILLPMEELRDIRLLDLTAGELEEISIRAGEEELVLRQVRGEWTLGGPELRDKVDEKDKESGETAGTDGKDEDHKAAEDASRSDLDIISRFVDEIQAFTALGFAFPDEDELKDYGFDPPAAVMAFKTQDGDEQVLMMGAETDRHLYVRRKGEHGVVVVHRELKQRFQPDRLTFRHRGVLEFDNMDLKKIRAVRGAVEEVLERDEGEWKLVKPVEIGADRDGVETFARVAGRLKAERYVAPVARPEHGLGTRDAHRLAFTVESPPVYGADGIKKEGTGETTVHELEIGPSREPAGCFGRLLSGDRSVFRLDELTCSDLRAFLADRNLLDLRASAVQSLRIRGPRIIEELEKRGPEWHRKAGPRVDNIAVEDFIGLLAGLRARGVAGYLRPRDAHGAHDPHVSVSVETEKGVEKTLLVGSEVEGAGGGRYCWVGNRDILYILSSADVKRLEEGVRQRVVAPTPGL